MSCWRVLHLSDSDDRSVPQLLIKPVFRPDSYTVFLTDLSNIWSEELGLDGILDRVSKLESPIEVSPEDKSQLTILLAHVKQSLVNSDGSNRRLTKSDSDEIVLHTTNRLPDPLGSLAWTFNLRKRNSAILKNELILPLLLSSHIQHERVNELLSTVREKDRAITRFVDQFESSNIDLALAFPSLAPMKTGRRAVKREQAARHIPALQPFDDERWMQETAELKDGHISTLGLFQEALSDCNPKVPVEMASEDVDSSWWRSLGTQLSHKEAEAGKTKKQGSPPPKLEEEDETDTEDDFETHPNFKLRQTKKQRSESPMQTGAADREEQTPEPKESDVAKDEETEDDDLDAPPKIASQSQRQKQVHESARGSNKRRSPTPRSPSPQTSPVRRKRSGFTIGGHKARKAETRDEADEASEASSATQERTESQAATPKRGKGFTIGGRNKAPVVRGKTASTSPPPAIQSSRSRTVTEKPPSVAEGVSERTATMTSPQEEKQLHGETPEEKAERRRQELKRNNEELAKQQAHRKKRRF